MTSKNLPCLSTLTRLKQLDIAGNKLFLFPESLSALKNLYWLDTRENPFKYTHGGFFVSSKDANAYISESISVQKHWEKKETILTMHSISKTRDVSFGIISFLPDLCIELLINAMDDNLEVENETDTEYNAPKKGKK